MTQVEQFEDKKVLFGLNKVIPEVKKAHFHIFM